MAENYGTLEGTLDEHGVLSGEMSDRATLEGEIQFGSGGGGVLDVLQNGQSVVEGRYAYVTVPTFLKDLRADDYHNTVTRLEMEIWNGKANPSDIPTKLSELDNDANYVQDADYVHTDNNFTDEDKAAIGGIPENITDLSDVEVSNIQNGQVLKWDSNQNKFVNANESGGGSGDVADVKVNGQSVVDPVTKEANIDLTGYAETSDIPTDLADLSDDSTHRLVTDTEKSTWDNKSDFSGSYNDLTDKPTIPSAQVNSDWNANSGVAEILNKPTLGAAAAKDSTNAVTQGSTDLVESGAVWSAIDNLPEPMIFKGTLGVGGTITSLPTASTSNNGYTYKVITDGTYDGKSAKVGDVFTSNATEWVLIPSGDETFTDTWRSVKVNGTELLGSSITTGAVNFNSGTNVTVSGSGNDITITAQDTTYSKATAQADGLMSKEDFSKLAGIASGAEVNVQANWNESDSNSDAYIQNKPQNLVQDASYVHSDNNYTTAEKTKLSGISTGANKTEASITNGNIKIDSVETPVYRNYGNNAVLTTDKTPFLTRQTLNPTGFSGYVREKLIGASYAWNQLITNGNFSNGTTDWTIVSRLTSSVSANVLTITVNTVGDIYADTFYPGIKGHKYLLIAKIKQASTTSGTFGLRAFYNGTANYETVYGIKDGAWHTFAVIISETTGGLSNRLRIFEQSAALNDTAQVCDCQCIDLTLAFGSTIADYLYGLSNNGGITKLRDMGCPIDKYTPYGYGLYSVKTSGKKIVGKNKNNNSNNVTGGYYESNGTWQASNDYATSGLIPVLPNTTYVGSMFDKNGNNRDSVVYTLWSDSTTCQGGYTTSTITTLSDTKFVRIRNYQRSASYITTKNFVFQLEIGSTNTAFEEYSCTTYSLGNDELRGKFDLVNGEIVASGDVKESNGEITRKYKLINLGAITFGYNSTWQCWVNSSDIPDSLAVVDSPANAISDKYEIVKAQGYTSSHATNTLAINNNHYLFIDNGSTTVSPTGYLVYELATPTTEQSTPFADPMSLVGATTEEYIDDRTIPCPVGAERQYMGQSEDVVEIPSSPLSDGKRKLVAETSGGKTQYYFEDDKNGAGTQVNLMTYNTSTNKYVCPSDGYITLSNAGASVGDYIIISVYGANDNAICGLRCDTPIASMITVQNLFVKRGMKCYVRATSSTGSFTALFTPLA